jgi:hypothetical protein
MLEATRWTPFPNQRQPKGDRNRLHSPEPVEVSDYPQPESRMPERREPENANNRQIEHEETPRAQRENRPNLDANHPNTTVVRQSVASPAMRRAMTYNNRHGIHIDPAYFATHYGREHVFRFPRYSGRVCIGDCGFIVFGEELYFNLNGGWFGIIGPTPGNWAFQTDDLYIDIGDDGNYYLYDAQFPGVAVQLTFVQNGIIERAMAEEVTEFPGSPLPAFSWLRAEPLLLRIIGLNQYVPNVVRLVGTNSHARHRVNVIGFCNIHYHGLQFPTVLLDNPCLPKVQHDATLPSF